MKVTKHFVTVGQRRVHFHRAGEGPTVALLHASPCSAKVLRLPLEVFAARFTAIAFDTPGFGLSDLLPLERRASHPCLAHAARHGAPQDVFARCLPLAQAARPDARFSEVQDTAESRAQAILHAISVSVKS